MKKLTAKKMLTFILVIGLAISSIGIASTKPLKASADVGGKVVIKPYIEYLFDEPDTLFENTGSSVDDGKAYTLSHAGNGAAFDMCYGGELNLEDNDGLYLEGNNNPFANGDLEDFTFTMQLKVSKNTSSNWWSSIVSWDSFSGNPDDRDHSAEGSHRYTRISSAKTSSDSDWLRFTDTQAHNLDETTLMHTSSYQNGVQLYQGNTSAADSGFITVVISVDKDTRMLIKAYQGTTVVKTFTVDLTGKNWQPYLTSATTKRFMVGAAWDSRSYSNPQTAGGKMEMKSWGRFDNVRVYDYALSSAEIDSYVNNQLQLVVDGVEIDPDIIGGNITANNYTPHVGEWVEFTVTPDANANLLELTVNETAIQPDGSGKYKAKMVNGGLFVSASFERSLPVTISSTVTNGTLTADKTLVKVGDSVNITATPNTGYGVKKVLVNGAPVTGTNNVYTVVMTDQGMEVSAEFVKMITVTVASGINNGTVKANKTSAFVGDRIAFTVTPDDGYEVDKVLVNGTEIKEEGGVYAVVAEGDITVSAKFKKEGSSGSEGGGCGSAMAIEGATAGFLAVVGAMFLVLRIKKRKGE